VVSSFMDAAHIERVGANRWEHLCEPGFDTFVASEFDAAYTLAHRFGARVAWATAPLEDALRDAATPTLRERLRCYNEILVQLTGRHRDIVLIPLAQHVDRPDGVVDRTQRPDGVHFSVAAGLALADQWLASALLALKRV
jgi:hypothetical protein